MTEDILGPLVDKLDPALVAPVVAWLVHEDCPVSGEIYQRRRRPRRPLLRRPRAPATSSQDLNVEDVRDNWEAVLLEEGYVIPRSANDEIGTLVIPNLAES